MSLEPSKNYKLISEPANLEIYQKTILNVKDIYCFSRENSRWYSENLPAFASDDDFSAVWERTPQLTKIVLRERGEEILTRERDSSTLEFITTGSTGIPTKTYWAGPEYNKCTLEVWNARKNLGAKLSDNIVYFNGLPENGPNGPEAKICKTSATTYELSRVFTEEATKIYCDFLNGLNGVVLYGSPSTLYNFANSIKASGISPPKLNCIEINGEMYEEYEYNTIQSVLNAPVLNNYGAREMWPIALSCKCGTMHVCNNLVYVESNAAQEILVTSLVKKLQPLIRYHLGDLGEVKWAECECGKTSQILTGLIGRKNDYIYRSPGIREHWAVLSRAISQFICDNFLAIIEYSVHQKADYSIEISIVPGPEYNISKKEELLSVVEAIYPQIRFSIITVQEIKQNYRGKKVYLTCDVKEG